MNPGFVLSIYPTTVENSIDIWVNKPLIDNGELHLKLIFTQNIASIVNIFTPSDLDGIYEGPDSLLPGKKSKINSESVTMNLRPSKI